MTKKEYFLQAMETGINNLTFYDTKVSYYYGEEWLKCHGHNNMAGQTTINNPTIIEITKTGFHLNNNGQLIKGNFKNIISINNINF